MNEQAVEVKVCLPELVQERAKFLLDQISDVRPNDLVLDPFCGSGTNCLASEILNRKWIGIDNNSDYCEIARKRLSVVPEKLEAFMKFPEEAKP